MLRPSSHDIEHVGEAASLLVGDAKAHVLLWQGAKTGAMRTATHAVSDFGATAHYCPGPGQHRSHLEGRAHGALATGAHGLGGRDVAGANGRQRPHLRKGTARVMRLAWGKNATSGSDGAVVLCHGAEIVTRQQLRHAVVGGRPPFYTQPLTRQPPLRAVNTPGHLQRGRCCAAGAIGVSDRCGDAALADGNARYVHIL